MIARRTQTKRRAFFETLESRQLLAGDPLAGYALPYQLDFNRSKTGVFDRDGSGTGFTFVQPNSTGTEYDPSKIDLKIGAGILRLYAVGNNSTTTNFEADNSLQNVLQMRYSASSKPWVISTRINGPLPQLASPDQQGGIIFGPDADDWVKLAVGVTSGGVGIQFLDEQKFKSGYRHQLSGAMNNIGSLNSIQTLDLYLAGDPTTGIIRALYRVNSGDIIEIGGPLQLRDDKRAVLFSDAGFAGLFVQNHNNNGQGIEMTFDQFGVKRGVLEPTDNNPPPPPPPGDEPSISAPTRKIFNDVKGASGQTIVTSITNTGNADLHVSNIALNGTDASQFSFTSGSSTPATIAPGASLTLNVTFSASSSTTAGIKTANLVVTSDDPDTATKTIRLRGLATTGQGGSNEPSLQRIMDLYEIPISVGDSNPNDYLLDNPPVQPNDEVDLQRMVAAGAGPVTIQPLAVFGVGSSTTPTNLFGYYPSGTPEDIVQMLSIQGTGNATQTVSPNVIGNTSFTPAGVFSLYMRFPSMYPTVVNTPGGTTGYGQDILNQSYDPNSPRKIRFYTFKDSAGNVVPNAYVFAGEDLNAAYDTQDFVGVISNVAAAPAGAQIGFTNPIGAPFGNRLVFNRITNLDPNFPNVVHDTSNLLVTNTGTSTLSVTNITLPTGFSLTAGGTSFTVAPGASKKLTIKFTGSASSGNKLFTGNMVITSNDPSSPTSNVQLQGFWQHDSEHNEEPLLTQVVSMLGYSTAIVNAGQLLDGGGKVEAVGDEVLSPFWLRADPSLPVSVTQLAAWHTEGTAAVFKWYPQGSSSRNVLFTEDGDNSQSFFPLQDASSSISAGSFNPSTAFALKVDGEGSDDASNVQEHTGGGWGHHVRFWPVKDRNGNLVPNTYLMGLDYNGINYDYNDNVYLVSNMKPSGSSGATVTAQSVQTPTAQSAAATFGNTRVDPSTLLDGLNDSSKNLT